MYFKALFFKKKTTGSYLHSQIVHVQKKNCYGSVGMALWLKFGKSEGFL